MSCYESHTHPLYDEIYDIHSGLCYETRVVIIWACWFVLDVYKISVILSNLESVLGTSVALPVSPGLYRIHRDSYLRKVVFQILS